MSITVYADIESVDQERFHAIDKKVMRYAFDIQNEMGRFFDIYQNELAYRCEMNGLEINREVKIEIIFEDFEKAYFVDLLIENGAVYELKTVETLLKKHESQLLNYLMLTNLRYGKLVNFRSKSVGYRFVSTSLCENDRKEYVFNCSELDRNDKDGIQVLAIMESLLAEWGAFLDLNLYSAAVGHFLLENTCKQPVDIVVNGRVCGTQDMQLIGDRKILHLSAVTKNPALYEKSIMRMLRHTKMERLIWFNFNKHNVLCKILKNDSA